jgi:integrase
MSIRHYLDKNGNKLYEAYAIIRKPDGGKFQMKRKGIKSLRQAELVEFELKRQLANRVENHSAATTWAEWFETCMSKMKIEFKPSTMMNYEGQLKKWAHPVWRERFLEDITPQDVHELIYREIHGVTMHARKSVLKMTKRILQMAVEEGILRNNPALKVKVKVPETKQAVLNTTEVDTLLREAKLFGHKFYEIWAVALLTGMRSGELYALKWSDVDFENHRITVSQSWCSKNGYGPTKSAKNRVVPICDELVALLKELRLKKCPEYEFVLSHLRDWTMGDQAEILREFCKLIGITPVRFHDLRATFITQLLLKGVPLAQVMAVVGHSQIKTTNVYLRLAGADLSGVTNKLGFTLPTEQQGRVLTLPRRS